MPKCFESEYDGLAEAPDSCGVLDEISAKVQGSWHGRECLLDNAGSPGYGIVHAGTGIADYGTAPGRPLSALGTRQLQKTRALVSQQAIHAAAAREDRWRDLEDDLPASSMSCLCITIPPGSRYNWLRPSYPLGVRVCKLSLHGLRVLPRFFFENLVEVRRLGKGIRGGRIQPRPRRNRDVTSWNG